MSFIFSIGDWVKINPKENEGKHNLENNSYIIRSMGSKVFIIQDLKTEKKLRVAKTSLVPYNQIIDAFEIFYDDYQKKSEEK